MSKETLLTLRLIIPGLIFSFLTLPLVQPNLNFRQILEIKISTDTVLYLLMVVGGGAVYYVLKPRNLALGKSMRSINENIKHRLLSPFEKDKEIRKSIQKLHEGNQMLDIFYYFIDNDNSLKERAKAVYFNGLILSTFADLRIILPFALAGYLGLYAFDPKAIYLWAIIICAFGLASTFVSIPVLTKRHIALSNAQSDYIILNYKPDLKKRILQALK